MKTYLRLLQFARPIKKYATPYFFFTLLHAFFNMIVFMAISPVLKFLFDPDATRQAVAVLPPFELNTEYITTLVNYLLPRLLGANYKTIDGACLSSRWLF